MKKSKLTIGLVTGFVGTLALASCGGLKASNDSIMEIKDYNGNTVKIYTNDIFDRYAKSSTGLAKYYDAVLETLIRFNYTNKNFVGINKLSRDYATIENLAKNQVTSERKTAEQTAKTNKTKFEDEWEKVLKAKNCETDDDLVKYYIYQYEKEDMVDWYYKANESTLLKQYIGVDKDYNSTYKKDAEGKLEVQSKYPYHMRHILVKTAGSNTKYSRDVVTEKEAENLSNAMVLLTQVKDGKRVNSFGAVAGMAINEDTSKSSYGDLGMVTTETSFINEFKFGIYAYDALFSGINSEATQKNSYNDILTGLGLNSVIPSVNPGQAGETVKDRLNDINKTKNFIGTVPVEVFSELGKVKAKVKDDQGNQVCEGAEALYPRNVIWNRFLNQHNVYLITNENIEGEALAANPCFKEMNVNGEKKNILVDEEGRPVVCVRGQYGIHFMVMLKSVFKATNELTTADGKYRANLEDYYTTDADKAVANDQVTYVTSINRTDTIANYRTRADSIKSAVKSYDKTYDYRLFEALMDKSNTGTTVTFKNKTLEDNIINYIVMQKASNLTSATNTLRDSWRTYIEMLEEQNNTRIDYEPTADGSGYKGSLYKTVCYQRFGEGMDAKGNDGKPLFEKGGECYYGK